MVHDNKYLNEYINKHGGKYNATVFVGKKARQLCEKYDHVISHAEAITWLLSGVVPEGVKQYETKIKQREQRSLWYAKEYLSNILDQEVVESVLASIRKSEEKHHIEIVYKSILDENRRARVRILTRKIWDEMKSV